VILPNSVLSASSASWVGVAGTYYTSAETTSAEVRCHIPVFALDDNSTLQLYNWSISVSSNNSTWSNSSQLLVYDPMYVTCSDEGNQTTCLPAQVNQFINQSLAPIVVIVVVVVVVVLGVLVVVVHRE